MFACDRLRYSLAVIDKMVKKITADFVEPEYNKLKASLTSS